VKWGRVTNGGPESVGWDIDEGWRDKVPGGMGHVSQDLRGGRLWDGGGDWVGEKGGGGK